MKKLIEHIKINPAAWGVVITSLFFIGAGLALMEEPNAWMISATGAITLTVFIVGTLINLK